MNIAYTKEDIAFIDTEVNPQTGEIFDYGAITANQKLHTSSFHKFADLLQNSRYVCGHNILNHDIPYIQKQAGNVSGRIFQNKIFIDTL